VSPKRGTPGGGAAAEAIVSSDGCIGGLVPLTVRVKPARKARTGRNPATGEQVTSAAQPASVDVSARPLARAKGVRGIGGSRPAGRLNPTDRPRQGENRCGRQSTKPASERANARKPKARPASLMTTGSPSARTSSTSNGSAPTNSRTGCTPSANSKPPDVPRFSYAHAVSCRARLDPARDGRSVASRRVVGVTRGACSAGGVA
jgi:hypothetical protein